MTGRAAALALLVAHAGCGDGAVDATYPGEPLVEVAGALVTPSGAQAFSDPELARRVRIAFAWGDGASGALDTVQDAPVVTPDATRFRAALYTPPDVDAALRPSPGGSFALAQIVAYLDADDDGLRDPDEAILAASRALVLFAPEGVSGAVVGGATLAPGFHHVYPTVPCDVPEGRLYPAFATLSFDLHVDPAFVPDDLFFAPACAARLPVVGAYCPEPDVVRWVCRSRGVDLPKLCDPCEHTAFPEGAAPDVCERWAAWCHAVELATPDVCDGELRACKDGEPARATPCDIDCACDKAEVSCRAAPGADMRACAAKFADCGSWLDP